jgi:hypothetical protein
VGAWLVLGFTAFECLGNLAFAVECFDRAEYGGDFPPPSYCTDQLPRDELRLSEMFDCQDEFERSMMSDPHLSKIVMDSFGVAYDLKSVHNLIGRALRAKERLNDEVKRGIIIEITNSISQGIIASVVEGNLLISQVGQALEMEEAS